MITGATYNENGMWTEDDENDLYAFLDKQTLMDINLLFRMLLKAREKNNILLSWIKKMAMYAIFGKLL